LPNHPNLKLEDHPLLAVRDCLFNIFAPPLTLEVVPQSATWGREMPWWQGHIIPKILFGIMRRGRSGRSRLLYLFIRRVINQIVLNTEAYRFCQLCKKILFSILLSRLTPYAEEIIRNHQCGFRRSSSTTNHTICIPQILEKKWE